MRVLSAATHSEEVYPPGVGFDAEITRQTTELALAEAGVVAATPLPGRDEVRPGELGGVEAAVGMHIGPYDTLEQTYSAMMEWIKWQGRSVAGPMWEVYLTDPSSEPDPQVWRTEVFIPVA